MEDTGITKNKKHCDHFSNADNSVFSVRLTVIDTPGFGDYVNNRDSWQPIIEFLDDQHESYMLQEQQPRRTDKIDMRVHACLYFIRPTGHTLKPLDIEVMKRLSSRVNLIPVVAKAETEPRRSGPLQGQSELEGRVKELQIGPVRLMID